jgi:hypothetical protein
VPVVKAVPGDGQPQLPNSGSGRRLRSRVAARRIRAMARSALDPTAPVPVALLGDRRCDRIKDFEI